MKQQIPAAMSWAGMLLILAGLIIPFFTGPQEPVYKYIYGAGAVLNLAGRVFTRYDGRDIRLKRLLRIEVWAALFFCAALYFMFTDPNPRSWIALVLAAGVLMAYTSFMIQRVQRKNQ